MLKPFDRFIGIDWSGAARSPQKGIAVAIAKPGIASPKIVTRTAATLWSRQEVVDWLVAEAECGRVLIGIDFAFGFPPLPVGAMTWAEVDRHCDCDPDLYGGRFFSDRGHLCGEYVNGPWGKGGLYSARNYRSTEREASRIRGASPSCMLNGVGASAVGFSSTSGMRALVSLRAKLGGRLAIWPFDSVQDDSSVLVEIFPRLFPLLKGCKPAMSVLENLNAALVDYGSEPFSAAVASEDMGDAIVSAAALRTLSADAELWAPLPPEARTEGWIFGVPPGSDGRNHRCGII